MTTPLIGWYGDDFTGATDTLAVLAQAGLRAMLFMVVPGNEALAAAGPLDAVGIAGAARSMAPDAMRAELAGVGRFFQTLATPVLHYKVCSTFDSAPQVGNIACAIATLLPSVQHRWVPIVAGQPSLGRYCAFSNLFAAAGTGGTVHRIDRHPTMRQHPVTPMGEADLRLHLAAQGLHNIGALHYPQYATHADTLDATVAPWLQQPLLMDVADAAHLAPVGRLLWQQAQHARLLAVGSSVVAQALLAHWRTTGTLPASAGTPAAAPALATTAEIGPVFALAGSLSPLTARQVAAARSYARITVDAQGLAGDAAYASALLQEVGQHLDAGQHVLVCTAPTSHGAADTSQAGRVAHASARLVADVLARQAAQGRPLRRVGIAGGDTSSHAVEALDLWGLSCRATLCPGVTLSRAHSANPALDGLELMLKGGQMGGDDLFEQLLRPLP